MHYDVSIHETFEDLKRQHVILKNLNQESRFFSETYSFRLICVKNPLIAVPSQWTRPGLVTTCKLSRSWLTWGREAGVSIPSVVKPCQSNFFFSPRKIDSVSKPWGLGFNLVQRDHSWGIPLRAPEISNPLKDIGVEPLGINIGNHANQLRIWPR